MKLTRRVNAGLIVYNPIMTPTKVVPSNKVYSPQAGRGFYFCDPVQRINANLQGTSVMRFIITLLLVTLSILNPAHAEPKANDATALWSLGVLLGFPALLSVCSEKYPKFNEQNFAAYDASAHHQPNLDKLLVQPNTDQIEDESIKKLVEAQPAVRATLKALSAEALYTLCEKYPLYLERQSRIATGESNEALKQHLIQNGGSDATRCD